MRLINKYLPKCTFAETHSVEVKAPQVKCYREMLKLDLSKIWIVNMLFKLRRLPVKAQRLSEFTRKMNFTLLEENPFSEFIFGFGVNNKGIDKITDRQEFITNDFRWFQKVVWSFEFMPLAGDQTKITTITRVRSYTKEAKARFSNYWFFVRPFSGLIRKAMLKKLKQNMER